MSRKQHGYYRSVIVPEIAKYCGYESHAEAHKAIKSAFFGMSPEDPHLPSMSVMSDEEAGRLIDYALRVAAEMSLVLPDPRKYDEQATNTRTKAAGRREDAR